MCMWEHMSRPMSQTKHVKTEKEHAKTIENMVADIYVIPFLKWTEWDYEIHKLFE